MGCVHVQARSGVTGGRGASIQCRCILCHLLRNVASPLPGAAPASLAADVSVDVSAAEVEVPAAASSQLAVSEPPCIPLGEYLISIQLKSKFRRLHRHGDCHLRAGVDFTRYELLGSDEPDASTYTAKCKHCFKSDARFACELDDSSATSSPTESECEP